MVTPRDRFNDPAVRDKVTRVVLLWVNNHFTDFETDPSMMEFLETFECLLEQSKMQSHVSLIFHPKIFVRRLISIVFLSCGCWISPARPKLVPGR